MQFGSSKNSQTQEKWRWQIDNFVDDNAIQLAALTWGLQQEWNDKSNTILGIDLKPTPHFVACSREQIEKLNKSTKGHLQEILGLMDGYQPEIEVLNLVIGEGQVKLIHFQPQTPPPVCLESEGKDIEGLIEVLENKLQEYLFF
jgi:hypothetical protein